MSKKDTNNRHNSWSEYNGQITQFGVDQLKEIIANFGKKDVQICIDSLGQQIIDKKIDGVLNNVPLDKINDVYKAIHAQCKNKKLLKDKLINFLGNNNFIKFKNIINEFGWDKTFLSVKNYKIRAINSCLANVLPIEKDTKIKRYSSLKNKFAKIADMGNSKN